MRRLLLRETAQERRRRRCRVATERADEQLDWGTPRLALRWAKRAHRLDPSDPRTLMVLGLALSENHRHELALKHLEASYHILTEGHDLNPLATDLHVVLAIEAARVCARLRLDTHSQHEAEAWAERVLHWARLAVAGDAESAGILRDDPLLRDLGAQVWLLHASGPAHEVWA